MDDSRKMFNFDSVDSNTEIILGMDECLTFFYPGIFKALLNSYVFSMGLKERCHEFFQKG